VTETPEYDSVVEHMLENQIKPQLIAKDLASRGFAVDVQMANTAPDAQGFEVTCSGCGRTARVPVDPGRAVAMCPSCMRGQRP
jgi:hypothetical protein